MREKFINTGKYHIKGKLVNIDNSSPFLINVIVTNRKVKTLQNFVRIIIKEVGWDLTESKYFHFVCHLMRSNLHAKKILICYKYRELTEEEIIIEKENLKKIIKSKKI